jgi:hypothetical protein
VTVLVASFGDRQPQRGARAPVPALRRVDRCQCALAARQRNRSRTSRSLAVDQLGVAKRFEMPALGCGCMASRRRISAALKHCQEWGTSVP